MSRTPRACLFLILFASLLTTLPTAARADDEKADPQKDPLRWQIIDISALTAGNVDHSPPHMGFIPPNELSNLESPLFGSESEVWQFPVGSGDDVIESIKRYIMPRTWAEEDGADILVLGERGLVVRARKTVIDAVARHLAQLQSQAQEVYTLDAIVVPMTSHEAHAAVDPLTGVVKDVKQVGSRLVQAASHQVRVCAMAGQRVVAWDGAETSYIGDHDVEVAQDARIADPIISVMNSGLALGARMEGVRQSDYVVLELKGGVVLPGAFGERTGGSPGALVTTIDTKTIDISAHRVVPTGSWVLMAAGAETGHAVFVRVARRAHAEAVTLRGEALDSGTNGESDRLTTRWYPVRDLNTAIGETAGSLRNTHLRPSNYTPPMSLELADPMPAFPAETLPDMIRGAMGRQAWARRGASIELTNGVLVVRNTQAVQQAVARNLQTIRKGAMSQIATQAHLIELSATDAEAVLARDEPLRTAERETLLSSASTRVLDVAAIRAPAGVRRHATAGRERSYVSDYEVEIAQEAMIANPVVNSFFEGLHLVLRPEVTVGGDGVHLAWSFSHTAAGPSIPQRSTPHGMLDLPRLVRAESHGKAQVRFDHTLIANASRTKEGRVRLLLLTPRFVPAPQSTAAGGDDPDRSR